jgi:tetratricopeptide (TPR) repeat protein
MLPFKKKESKRYHQRGDNESMSTQLDTENGFEFDKDKFQERLPQHYRAILADFQKNSRSFVRFNMLFLILGITEILALATIIPLMVDSIFIALSISALFLTSFTYLVLLFYYQARKPEQMSALLTRFISSCRTSLGVPQGVALHHLSVAETLIKLSHYLSDYEWQFVKSPDFFSRFSRPISRFSAYCHWHDVFHFKQLLLHAAVEEHLNQIRATPTDLEVHASLANSYVVLSQVYKEPKGQSEAHPRLKNYKKHAALFDEKFKTAASLAIEEFRILSHYAPNDPWVHEQLASGYHELDLHEEEILEIETLLKLRPQDKEILFRLGMLYFQQGLNAKGLQVFEELKKANYRKAEDLISTYGKTSKSLYQLSMIEL